MYRPIFALLSSYGILLLANGLFGTIISINAKAANFSDSVIGLVWAGYFLGLLLSPFTSIRAVASIGHIRAFAAFASLASVVAVAHLLWVNPFFWGMLRIVSGVCMGGMIVVTEGWLNERASNKNRGTILSVYMITTYACSGGAQLILMFGGENNSKLFIIVSMLFSFALMPILMSRSQAPSPSMPKRPSLNKLFAISPVGIVGSFVVGFINGIYYSFAPVFAYGTGLSLKQTAIFIALGTSSGMLLQLPLGKLSDKIDRRIVIAFSAMMTSLACYLLYSRTDLDSKSLYILAIFYGSVAFSLNALCVAHTNDLTPPEERTQTSSGLLMMYGVGAILGPTVTGFIITHSSVNNLFAVSGSVAFVFMLYVVSRLIFKPRKDQEKISFLPYAVQSPARRLNILRKRK